MRPYTDTGALGRAEPCPPAKLATAAARNPGITCGDAR